MKATGIVRRIDELGRIVVPKEIRKNLRLKEGENLEIFVDTDNNLILKKHAIMNKIEDFAQTLTDSIYSILKHNIIITNTDTIIALTGNLKKNYLNKPISEKLENILIRREKILETHNKKINITNDDIEGTYALVPIIYNGDVAGSIIIFDDNDIVGDTEYQLCQIVSNFLGKYLED